MIPVRSSFHSDSHSFDGIDSTNIFCLMSSNGRQVFLQLRRSEVLKGIAAGIGISNFLRPSFMVCLNYSSSGSKKKIPRICLAFSSFGFSIVHFCYSLRFDASDICFHISGHNLLGLAVVCFLATWTVETHPTVSHLIQ